MAALKTNGEIAEARSGLGILYAARGRFDAALEQFEMAVRISPSNIHHEVKLGVIYGQLGETEAAQKQFETARQQDPDYLLTYYELAHLFRQLGDVDGAIGHLKRLIARLENKEVMRLPKNQGGSVWIVYGER